MKLRFLVTVVVLTTLGFVAPVKGQDSESVKSVTPSAQVQESSAALNFGE